MSKKERQRWHPVANPAKKENPKGKEKKAKREKRKKERRKKNRPNDQFVSKMPPSGGIFVKI
jgi:hypothetical protein